MNLISGLIVEAVLSFLSSFGSMAMNIKKSNRSDLFPIIAAITTVFGANGGARISFNIQRADHLHNVWAWLR